MTTTKSPVTSHVLDIANGRPAEGLNASLSKQSGASWTLIARGTTNADGRIADWLPGDRLEAGTYRVDFETGDWLRSRNRACFYPSVSIVFAIEKPQEHYHIPLLLSDYGYSTYRGS